MLTFILCLIWYRFFFQEALKCSHASTFIPRNNGQNHERVLLKRPETPESGMFDPTSHVPREEKSKRQKHRYVPSRSGKENIVAAAENERNDFSEK